MKIRIIAITAILTCLFTVNLKAQNETIMVSGRTGSGTASSTKIFKKVVQLIDQDTKLPIPDHIITLVRERTPFNATKTDKSGYGTLVFTMQNYYSKVEVSLDNQYTRPEWKSQRNSIVYKPIDDYITFPSKKEVVDTVKIYVRKLK